MKHLRVARLALLTAVVAGICTAAFAGGGVGTGGGGQAIPVPPDPPTLTLYDFYCTNEYGTTYVFNGQVDGNTMATSITVYFSNMAALDGQEVAVNPDGSFVFIVSIPAGQTGFAFAYAVDNFGNVSNEAECVVN